MLHNTDTFHASTNIISYSESRPQKRREMLKHIWQQDQYCILLLIKCHYKEHLLLVAQDINIVREQSGWPIQVAKNM